MAASANVVLTARLNCLLSKNFMKLIFVFSILILAVSSQNARLGQSKADFEEFPYMALVYYTYAGETFTITMCTGVLLSLQHVLISDDCFGNGPSPDGQLSFSVGSNVPFWNEKAEEQVDHNMQDLEEYVHGNLRILKFPQEFSNTPAIMNIFVASEFQPSPNAAGYYIVGYPSQDSYSALGDQLPLVKSVAIANNRTYCNDNLVPDSELCTGEITGGSGACGWKGGILVRKGSNSPENDELYGFLNKDCCGVPRCFDTFYDLTNSETKLWIDGILGNINSEVPLNRNDYFDSGLKK